MYTALAPRAGPRANGGNASTARGRAGDRCRSDSSSVGAVEAAAPPSRDGAAMASAGDLFRLEDQDVVARHVLVESRRARRNRLDAIHDVDSVDDLAEYAIAPALRARTLVVEKGVVR